MRFLVAALLVAGCSSVSDKPTSTEPSCATWAGGCVDEDGNNTTVETSCSELIGQPTTAELLEAPCTLPDGSVFYGGSSTCSNGITILWNDNGWGYAGEPLQSADTWPGGCSGE